MLINKKTDTCACCGTYCEHNFGEENYKEKELDLDNYFKYKDIYVYKCPTCEMVSTNLSAEDKNLFEAIKNTDRYRSVVTYDYLEGVDLELYENMSRAVPANLYEVYAMMYENSNNKETYLRALHKSIELKELMMEKYRDEVEEDEDENDEELLERLEELMDANLEMSRKKFINEFLQYEDKNEFLFLMFIENLIGLGELELADKNLDFLIDNSNISEDIVDYIENLIEEE